MKKDELNACFESEMKYPKLTNVFQSFRKSITIGRLSYLWKVKYKKPRTYDDFMMKYFTDNENKGDKIHSGRNVEEWNKIVNDFHKKALQIYPKVEIKTCSDYLLKKVIIDTLDGFKRELEFSDKMKVLGFRCEDATPEQDAEESIDFLLYEKQNPNKLAYLVQLKPLSFFIGNANDSLRYDRKKLYQNLHKNRAKYKVPMFAVIYDRKRNIWIKNEQNGYSFEIDKLINAKGESHAIYNEKENQLKT